MPYSISVFKEEVNRQRPSGKDKKEQAPFDSIIQKIETLQRDPRMSFMMKEWESADDPFIVVLAQLLSADNNISIVDLSGIPNEIGGITSAAIARTLFNFKLWQKEESAKGALSF